MTLKMLRVNHVAILAFLGLGFYFYMNKSPLGLRNNNPLNVRANGIVWNGATDENLGYVVFESSFYGLRAAARVLRTYRFNYGLTTVEQIISRWAPATENNTQAYIEHVSQVLEVAPSQPIPVERYPELMAVMILHENGSNPYSSSEIISGFNAGFYG